jgi:hypothetical protein
VALAVAKPQIRLPAKYHRDSTPIGTQGPGRPVVGYVMSLVWQTGSLSGSGSPLPPNPHYVAAVQRIDESSIQTVTCHRWFARFFDRTNPGRQDAEPGSQHLGQRLHRSLATLVGGRLESAIAMEAMAPQPAACFNHDPLKQASNEELGRAFPPIPSCHNRSGSL